MSTGAPLILFDPFPRSRRLIFSEALWERLARRARIVWHEDGPMPPELVDRHIGEAVLVIGQTELGAARIEAAPLLEAVINVEGNFLPNIDYAACFRRGIQVLAVAPAFAAPVAEMGLGLALDLARGITAADRAFRAGKERYGLAGNHDAFPLAGCDVGLIGFGNLGRALLPLLAPFRPRVRVFDPWLPDGYLSEFGMMPAPLDEVLAASRLIFVVAGVTVENRGMLGEREFALMRDGTALVLLSRADVVDWQALMQATAKGRIRAATDVFPEEPVAPDDPVRRNPNLLLSAHRAGGVREAFERIGEMVVDDALSILSGLPPVRLQPARMETVSRLRSRPGHPLSRNGT